MSDDQENAVNKNTTPDPVEVDELDEKSLESTSGGSGQVDREFTISEIQSVQCNC